MGDGEAPALQHVRLEGFLQEGFSPLGVAFPPDRKQVTRQRPQANANEDEDEDRAVLRGEFRGLLSASLFSIVLPN